ncbi:hypothetical protein K1719_000137 [Acacia pycnantha]|nr:hypothetical protein K1719_000137 [Acacia pycnantha]
MNLLTCLSFNLNSDCGNRCLDGKEVLVKDGEWFPGTPEPLRGSHIFGGHKYAGNVIIFGSNINGEIMGHWYGYVTPDDVPVLLQQHIIKGEILDSLRREKISIFQTYTHPFFSKSSNYWLWERF